ncbi:MAG: hypothetical protein ABIB98_02920 [bacterium]
MKREDVKKMIKLQNEKGVISIIVIAILVVVVVGVGYSTYRSVNQKPALLPVVPSAQPVATPKTLEINFTETGEIINWDSRTESYTENWTLLYAKPGNPAISVKLIFNETSLCDLGEGGKVCDESKFNNGDRARVEGNKNNGEVTVITLTKL